MSKFEQEYLDSKTLIEKLGFDENWKLDFSEATFEGNSYKVGNIIYDETSDIIILNLNTGDKAAMWLDYAWCIGMNRPIPFVEHLSITTVLKKAFSIKNMTDPHEYIKEHTTEEQFNSIMSQSHFVDGAFRRLYVKSYLNTHSN